MDNILFFPIDLTALGIEVPIHSLAFHTSKDELWLKWVSEDSASFLEVTALGEEACRGTAKKLGCRFLLLAHWHL